MIEQTLDLPLEKLVLTPEGCEIFDILCLQLDINQKHVDDRTFLNAVECAAKSEGCINAFYLESIFREACPNQSSYSKI